jgi:hypothetical protein
MRYLERGSQPEFDNNRKEMVAEHGKGRAIYLPLIRKDRQPVRTYEQMGGYDGFAYLALSRNWRKLPETVLGAAVRPLSIKVQAPWTVASEFLKKSGSKRVLVHLVNYAKKKVPAGVAVALADGAGRTARLHMPGEGIDGRELKPARGKGSSVAFKLPAFARYALVVVD